MARSKSPKSATAPAPETAPPEPAALSAEEPAILARLEAPSKWSLALITGGLVLAAGLGVFAVRGAMRKKGEA